MINITIDFNDVSKSFTVAYAVSAGIIISAVNVTKTIVI